jgi:AraC-like DNA-binding protein
MKHYKNLVELHKENGFPPPENQLYSIYLCNKLCTFGERAFTTDFYTIGFKKLKSGVILYGKTKYDHENGSLMFFKPGQIVEMRNLEFEDDAFLIFVHEDFLNGHPLHNDIKKYHYFDYETNESLHLSPREEGTIWELFHKIENEYFNNLDEYSREIVLANLDTMLKYSQRFYKRQFINRKEISGKVINKFSDALNDYFSNGQLQNKGLPTVQHMAEQLHLSPKYLSDLLKQESGKTALEHIHIHLISEAKNLLIGKDQSVSEIAYELGFENMSYFSKLFKREVGLSPVQFKRQLMN